VAFRRTKDPAYPLVLLLKKKWEKLRRSDCPAADRAILMNDMTAAVEGHIKEVCPPIL
jgi:hypothetical protein